MRGPVAETKCGSRLREELLLGTSRKCSQSRVSHGVLRGLTESLRRITKVGCIRLDPWPLPWPWSRFRHDHEHVCHVAFFARKAKRVDGITIKWSPPMHRRRAGVTRHGMTRHDEGHLESA